MSAGDLLTGLLVREFTTAARSEPPLRVLAATSMASLVAGLTVRAAGVDVAIAGGFAALDVDPAPSLSLGESALGFERSTRGGLLDTFSVLSRGWVGVAVTPAQLDARARTNLSHAGGSHDQPAVALPGSRGLPENNTSPSRVWYVIPNHSPRTLVAEVDFVSGPEPDGSVARRLITNFGVFVFDGHWRAESLHPGIDIDDVEANTGFDIDCAGAHATEPLSADELAAIAAVDPDDLRGLEASPDFVRMGEIIAAERS
jgi:glutaconate CoA-transferase subunit B